MSLVNWNDLGLPHPRIANNEIAFQSSFVRSQMSSGVARQRVLDSNPSTNIVCNFLLPDHQLELFKDFYKNALNNGVKWFEMKLKLGDEANILPVRIINTPNITSENIHWSLSLTVEISKLPISDYSYLLMLFGNKNDMLNYIHNIERVDFTPAFDNIKKISDGV